MGIGSSGQVVGLLERMSLETSVSERGEKEVRECAFVVMKLLSICFEPLSIKSSGAGGIKHVIQTIVR